MRIYTLLAALAAISVSSVSAEASDDWFKRKFIPWTERNFDFFDDEDEEDEEDEPDYAYADEEELEYLISRRERRRNFVIESETENEEWWLQDRARERLERRKKARKQALRRANSRKIEAAEAKKGLSEKNAKLVATAKSPKLASKKTDKPVATEVQTASLSPIKPSATPKSFAKTEPKSAEPKSSGKTIGCTAGAAVIVGYGFGDVKPKTCNGSAYAYSATRGGKIYEIKLTAASGEITDVKKLN